MPDDRGIAVKLLPILGQQSILDLIEGRSPRERGVDEKQSRMSVEVLGVLDRIGDGFGRVAVKTQDIKGGDPDSQLVAVSDHRLLMFDLDGLALHIFQDGGTRGFDPYVDHPQTRFVHDLK